MISRSTIGSKGFLQSDTFFMEHRIQAMSFLCHKIDLDLAFLLDVHNAIFCMGLNMDDDIKVVHDYRTTLVVLFVPKS